MDELALKKKIFTNRIRSHIANNKWEDLIKLFQGAEEAKVSSTLLKSTSKKIGIYLVSNSRYYEATIFFIIIAYSFLKCLIKKPGC